MSTRPGSQPVSLSDEIDRTIPVVEYISKNYDILVSIDTYRSEVAKRAVDAGAHIINDISGLTLDDNMAKVAADLQGKAARAVEAGIGEDKIIVDPGIGFGKKLEHNLMILNKLSEFKALGYPVLVGVSRKSFIGKILDLPAEERLEGSLASAVCSVLNGADILRMHDVKETVRAVKIAKSIKGVKDV